MTTTQFKQKTCPKCKRMHDNQDGVLCSFCMEEINIARSKIKPTPANYYVECLIEREGDTVANIGNIRYTFTRNERGDSVCEVINPGHYNQFMKIPQYRAYCPEEEEQEDLDDDKKDDKDDKPADYTGWTSEAIIMDMSARGKTDTEIAAFLGEGISRQAVTRIRTTKKTGE